MKPRQLKIALILLLLLIPCGRAVSQDDISIETRVDSRVVSIDDMITFRVIITAKKRIDNYSVNFPKLKDFDAFGETSTRNFSQFNGRINAAYGMVYTLGAKRKGNLSIPAMTVTVEGKKYRTKAVSVKVIESTLGDDIIIRFAPDKQKAFTGEQIELRTELLFSDNVRVSNYDFAEQPQFEGFIIIDDTSLGRQPPVSRIEYNGKQYYSALLKKQVLFPLSPGKKSLKPFAVRVQYRRTSIGSQLKMSTIQTKKMEIRVASLPAGAPDNFLGAVGKYELTWSVDRTGGKANEPFTLKVELRGLGDIERVPDMQLNLPDDIEIINSNSTNQAKLMQGFWGGTRNWEYIIIPKKRGSKNLGPLSFTFFNPDEKHYQTVSTPVISLDVAESDIPAATVLATMPQADAKEGDVRFIKTSDSPLITQEFSFISSWWFWSLLALFPFINLLIYISRLLMKLAPGDSKGIKKKNAISTAINELENIGKTAESSRDSALPRIQSAIVSYFQDKLELPGNETSFSEIRSQLVRFDLHESPEIDRLNRILDMCQADKFAPVQEKKLTIAVMAKSVIMDLKEVDKKI